MTIKDKFIAVGDLTCKHCGEKKKALMYGDNPDVCDIVCVDCVFEMAQVLGEIV